VKADATHLIDCIFLASRARRWEGGDAMNDNGKDLLMRLGAGESIAAVCAAAGWDRPRFEDWWREECRRRVRPADGIVRAPGLRSRVHIRRDDWGVPHVAADTDADLFLGFGYATAQDRLFQLDYLRRKARGRLAEVLGREAVESDVLYRTLDLAGIAEAEWRSLPEDSRDLITAYAAGVNAVIGQSADAPPIEFDLLDYRPELWSPVDCLAIAGEFRWYLTGRFPVIVLPELVKRALGDGPIYHAFLQGEEDGESILPPGSYPAGAWRGTVGQTAGDPDEGHGSNNWVLAALRTTTGRPIVASDPHVPFGAVSIWHEVHLRGGSFHVAGVAYAGMPAVMIGRTERVAWGITNNICSLRDLYQEATDPAHPGCFLHDGRWEPARERQEIIRVRGAGPVVRTVRSSRNGPLVEDVLPGPARDTGPVSLRWLGAEPCGWLPALLGMNRARSAEEFREATRPWVVPTFNLVFADADGHIGHQCVGRIPVRRVAERGYRPGGDPRHQWDGVIPFDAMPRQTDPARGFAVTANNRLAPPDFPWPLSGTWSSGHRARRIREEIEARPRWSPEDCRRLQLDVRSGRAAACVPPLLAHLESETDPRLRRVADVLKGWDYRVEPHSVAAAVFNVFFAHWCRVVTAERLPRDVADLAAGSAGGLAASLLGSDPHNWFGAHRRGKAVRTAFRAAVDELTLRLGPDVAGWTWDRLHTLVLKHFLSGRGDLGLLLDRSGQPAPGDVTTVCSTTSDAHHAASLGASYRMVADLADPRQGLWTVDLASVSGHPGGPHYDDQLALWTKGACHYLPLVDDRDAPARATLTLEPQG
jgi:penicillin amidase